MCYIFQRVYSGHLSIYYIFNWFVWQDDG
uniref:Uncharacterized protein n=1 Tax=Arundo donax TaxID=35708 RepID=A0A0A9GL87_ARUDO